MKRHVLMDDGGPVLEVTATEARLVDISPCGHPLSAIAGGPITWHCGECEKEQSRRDWPPEVKRLLRELENAIPVEMLYAEIRPGLTGMWEAENAADLLDGFDRWVDAREVEYGSR